MADDDQPLQLIDHADPDAGFPLLDSTSATSSSSSTFVPPPHSDGLHSPKLESTDEYRLLPPGNPPPAPPKFNFRKQKRHRVMQSCVACHTQKRKCDRKRPCTRCVEHGISGMCVYQLEDPSQRDGPDQEELWRLRNRVAELERTVRVLMQKPLSRRAAAALEAETDALLGTTSTRKRKIDKEKETDDERAKKAFKSDHDVDGGGATPGWMAYTDTSFPSPADSVFSPYGATPSESTWSHYNSYSVADDVPTPPYSAFPTPSTDAGSPFKVPMDPVERRFSTGSSLANMLSQTGMLSQTPESMAGQSPVSPISTSGVPFSPIANAAPPGKCGCGVNPIGNEVLSGLQQSLEAAYDVINTLPDHQVGGRCVLVIGMASLLEAIHVHTQQNTAAAVSASPPMSSPPTPAVNNQMHMSMPPPPLPMSSSNAYMTPAPSNHMTPSSSAQMSPLTHMSPSVSEQGPSPHSSLAGPSPHSSIASPANYHLYNGAHNNTTNTNQGFYHSEIPTVSGFTSLSSWASFTGSAAPLLNNNCDNSLSNFDGHHNGHNITYMPHNTNGLTVYDQQHP
ncbi:hypothetical protein FRB96_001543 [Tulasnella sp. 330]|nr:hypothetical protein FRB96_001543 [Tulasnella sp. 330]KAG8886588.1 hypothetical protein FRB97_000007 [Tulasnella sp. 331]KAG8890719.1 hypothetical protein FRB98_006223 [Tulasnella sp. 332]